MDDTVIGLLVVVLAAAVAYFFIESSKKNVFRQIGVPYMPNYPIISSFLLMKKGAIELQAECIKKYGQVFGGSSIGVSFLNTTRVDFVKEVMVKQFHNFEDRPLFIALKEAPLEHFLSNMKGENWKYVRNTITPTFTSGKLKMMIKQINTSADSLVEALKKKAQEHEKVAVKDFMGRYSMDVIASTAFGLDIDAQNDPDSPFIKHSRNLNEITPWKWKLILLFTFPTLYLYLKKIFRFQLMDSKALEFFANVVSKSVENRKATETKRVDFLHLLSRADKSHLNAEELNKDELGFVPEESVTSKRTGLTNDELLANCILFFMAGYDTTATTLSYLCYNLARNPDIQTKLIEEIDTVVENQDEITYDIISRLTYLDWCLNESMRLYPVAPGLQRVAVKPTTLGGIHIPEGLGIQILAYHLHRNPDVYPAPERFIPERFSPEAKANRDPYNFLPFGLGPRNCVGMRLALLEMKVAMIKLLKTCSVRTCEETQIPLQFKSVGLLQTNKPIILKFEMRR